MPDRQPQPLRLGRACRGHPQRRHHGRCRVGAALEAGLEEVNDEDETWEAVCDPGDTVEVRKAIEAAGFDYDSSEVQFVASFDQEVDTVELAQKIFRIIDALEDSDDVQNVFTNLDLTPEVAAALDSED